MSEPFIEKHAISTKLSNVNQEKHRRKSHRVCRPDREPSRIPIRSLKRLRIKSRKVRKFVYARVLLWIPVSFTLYCYVNTKKLLNKKTFKLNCRERILQCIWKVKYRASRWLKLMCSCKDEARVANYCNYKLSRDRRTSIQSRLRVSFGTECRTTMCCDESVFFDLQWHTRDQLSKWSYTNNEYWKSALFKFVTISQTGTFNAVRITNSIKCFWYWLSTWILSLPLPVHLFIFFLLLCELTGRLVAMGHVLMCEIKNKLSLRVWRSVSE